MKKLLLLLILNFTLQSCENKEQKDKKRKAVTSNTINSDSVTKKSNKYDETEINSNEEDIVYPKTGKTSIDFLPTLNIYEIQNETKGDLNKDGLMDIAVVLVNKEVKTDERPMLILLQNKDKSYRLDKISNLAMPIEYAENGFQLYNSEEISIKNGILKIHSFGSGGPSGNLFSEFKYFGNDLILTHIETYNVGAGSWQQLYYNLEKGEIKEVITNTMDEQMPSKEKIFESTKEKHKFENSSPDNIIIEAYKKIDSEW